MTEKDHDVAWRPWMFWLMRQPTLQRLGGKLGRSRGSLRPLAGWRKTPQPSHRPDFSNWQQQTLALAWLGHATMLLRIGGLTVLTDPIFSSRAGLGIGPWTAGPRRRIAPAVELHQLPPIDLILVSHAHFDHLDRPTLARLPKHVPVLTSEHNSDLIRDLGFANVTEMLWDQQRTIAGLRVTALRVAHWGARTVFDRHRGYTGFLLENEPTQGQSHAVLYAGDTAYQEYFQQAIFEHRKKPVDLAVMGIGAYDPWIESHATPEQVWKMFGHIRAQYLAPMHHSTFILSREPVEDPLRRLLNIAAEQSHRIVIREIGQQWTLPSVPGSAGGYLF